MKNKIHSSTLFVLTLLLLATVMFNCESEQANSDSEQTAYESTVPEEVIKELMSPNMGSTFFAYATMAESINDTAFFNPGARDSLVRLAHDRIYGATHDRIMIDSIGIGGELVWGPAIVTKTDTDGKQSSANLMYCVKQDRSGSPVYVVGIAGTNPISKYDWFYEDLAVDSLVSWTPGGSISIGSKRGFDVLNGMTDSRTGQTLTAYLQVEVDASSTVIVTGHSLGGALAQVMTSHLRQNLRRGVVGGITYAGPSAGNEAFIDALYTSVSSQFIGYNNHFDAVPHAWQTDQLNELCSLYDGQNLCLSGYQHNVLVNGIVNYMKEISAAGNYANLQVTVPFSKLVPMKMGGEICDEGTSGLYLYLRGACSAQLNTIKQHCGGGSGGITLIEAQNLAFYMVAMGLNHTTAYMDYFIPSPTIRSHFSAYAPGAKAPLQETADAEYTLDTFLQRIADYYSKPGSHQGNCGCS